MHRALWMTSTVAVQRDPMFKTYYEKKAFEGIRRMKIKDLVTKKDAQCCFSILHGNTPYALHYQ